jgi:hypothetical protein
MNDATSTQKQNWQKSRQQLQDAAATAATDKSKRKMFSGLGRRAGHRKNLAETLSAARRCEEIHDHGKQAVLDHPSKSVSWG